MNLNMKSLRSQEILKKHLLTHKDSKKWIIAYDKDGKFDHTNKPLVTDKTVSLIKFFINSNIAVHALKDKYLREILPVNLPSKYYFQNRLIPGMIEFIKKQLFEKMKNSIFIHLITDIWTNVNMSHFLAVETVVV